ncbi:MAG TPA: carbon storage regulator [Povalibacter sp.]|jgi:carbon storage regulator CsrA|nr:carbon storage regulator [Povalibacter sp.]
MLALTRAIGESIIIGDEVEIRITHTEHGLVELQIEHPLDVAIHVPPPTPFRRPRLDDQRTSA